MIRVLHVDDSGRYAADLIKILQLPADWESTCIPADELKSAANSGYCAYQIASWANHIALQFPNDKIIITIHVSIRIPGRVYRSYCYGVEILEAIRIHDSFKNEAAKTDVANVIQHAAVIMYSWAPAECLIRNRPENARIFSPGATFVQLPFYDSKHRDAFFWAEQQNSVDPQLYAPFFDGHTPFSADGTRHSQANRFGIGVMIDALNKIYDNLPPDLLKLKPAGIKMPYMGADISRMLFHYRRKLNEIDLEREKDNLEVITNNLRAIAGNLSGRKIALVDDEAAKVGELEELGWKRAFEYLLLQQNAIEDLFSTHAYHADQKAHAKQIARQIALGQYACVLLDVRFPKDQRGTKKDIKKKFGYWVLKAIKKKCPAMPIIVVTSINKTWRHNQLIDAGADAIWVKEGVDELRTPRESLHNIVRLLELIKRVTGTTYAFLHNLNNVLNQLSNAIADRKVWWLQADKFGKQDQFEVDADVVRDILKDSFDLYRNYIKDITLNFVETPHKLLKNEECNQKQTNKESEFAKMLIMRLAQVIETIHGMKPESERNKQFNASFIRKRKDWLGYWLYKLRHECAHHYQHVKYKLTKGNSLYSGRSTQNYLSFLVSYLLSDELPMQALEQQYYEKWNGKYDVSGTKAPVVANEGFMQVVADAKIRDSGLDQVFHAYSQIQKRNYD